MDTQSANATAKPSPESAEVTIHLPEEPNCVRPPEEPAAAEANVDVDSDTGNKTHEHVLESLVNFSNVVSSTIADLQKVINQHTIDIANLQAEVDKLKSATASSGQQEDGQSTGDALASVDGMCADDEYESLLEKMEARRASLKTQTSQPQEPVAEEQKKTPAEKAREFLKELARQHNSSQGRDHHLAD